MWGFLYDGNRGPRDVWATKEPKKKCLVYPNHNLCILKKDSNRWENTIYVLKVFYTIHFYTIRVLQKPRKQQVTKDKRSVKSSKIYSTRFASKIMFIPKNRHCTTSIPFTLLWGLLIKKSYFSMFFISTSIYVFVNFMLFFTHTFCYK